MGQARSKNLNLADADDMDVQRINNESIDVGSLCASSNVMSN